MTNSGHSSCDNGTGASRRATPPEAGRAAEKLGLEPMRPLDLRGVRNAGDLLAQMGNTAFTGRTLGQAVDVTEAMLRDDSQVVLTLSGAMTMAGLNRLVIEMLDRGWVHCVISTGALVGHGLVEDLGMVHYKARMDISDDVYLEHQLNRVYDTIEPEENLDQMERLVRGVFDELAEGGKDVVGTAELLRLLGERLPGEGVLQVAARRNVPVFIPAFTDCELGLDFTVHRQRQQQEGRPRLIYDGFQDLADFRDFCEETVAAGRKLGIFTVGGGVPRNWAQQVGPYVDIRNKRLGLTGPSVRYTYGIRICPDPVHYGHLSGCTYSEGVSWGKFMPRSEGGRFAEVLLDATVGWPLIVQALIDRGL